MKKIFQKKIHFNFRSIHLQAKRNSHKGAAFFHKDGWTMYLLIEGQVDRYSPFLNGDRRKAILLFP